MFRRAAHSALCLSILALTASAWAGVDVEVRNADKVTGTISPATETETIRFRVPEGAVITVKAKAAKKGPEIHLVLRDDKGASLGTADGRAASIKGVVATGSGLYSAEVTSRDGTSTGDYSFGVTWKTPASATTTLELAPNGETTLHFAAEAGAKATFSVKKSKGSTAAPLLVSYAAPDATVGALAGANASNVLAQTGGYDLTFRNGGAANGSVVATVKVKPPKPAKRKIALTATVIGAGDLLGDTAFAAVIGPGGGTVSVPLLGAGQPGAEISGSSVSIPAGAFPSGTAIIVATAPALPGQGPGAVGAGPTVFFGPEGTAFDKLDATKSATITIPFDPNFASQSAQFQIYTRDAKGKITLVPGPYTFDLVHHTMSAATSHFSSFRVLSPDAGTAPGISTLVNVTDPDDLCDANDPTSVGTRNLYFVAQGSTQTVGAVRLAQGSGTPTFEVWVGGGTLTADGTNRLQFLFTNSVRSVTTSQSGKLYIATTTEIFTVDGSGNVSRIAGTGAVGSGGDNGPALQATFTIIDDIIVDTIGHVFIADAGAGRIRRIDPAGNIAAYAGSGSVGVGLDGGSPSTTTFIGPSELLLAPSGGVYVGDGVRIRHIDPFASPTPINQTVAGSPTGQAVSSGIDGPIATARFRTVNGLARLLDLANPQADLFAVADSADHTVSVVNLTTGTVTLVAGAHGTSGFSGDVGPLPGLLNSPVALVAAGKLVTIADNRNDRLRMLLVP